MAAMLSYQPFGQRQLRHCRFGRVDRVTAETAEAMVASHWVSKSRNECSLYAVQCHRTASAYDGPANGCQHLLFRRIIAAYP